MRLLALFLALLCAPAFGQVGQVAVSVVNPALPPLCPTPIATVASTVANNGSGTGGSTSAIDDTGATDVYVTASWSWDNTNNPSVCDSRTGGCPGTSLNTWDAIPSTFAHEPVSTLGGKWWHCRSPCSVGSNHTFTLYGGSVVFGAPGVIALSGTNGTVETANFGSAAATTGSSVATGYVTQQRNCEAVITAAGVNSASTLVTPTGYTRTATGTSAGVSQTLAIAVKVNTNATAEDPTWTGISSAGVVSALIVTSTNAPVAPVYTTPLCSVSISAGSCVSAWSMWRNMTGSATKAMQWSNGSTTADIGFSGGVVSTASPIAGLCSGNPANCWSRKIYDQVAGVNDATASTVFASGGGIPNCAGGTPDQCASVVTIDITTNLPVVTSGSSPLQGIPVSYNFGGNDADTTGLPYGSSARTWINVFKPRPQADGTSCCGLFMGQVDTNGISATAENFIPGAGYNQYNGGTGGVECTLNHYCVVIDNDVAAAPPGFEPDYSDHLIANMAVLIITYDTTNGTDFYLNGTHLGNWPESSSGPLNTGKKLILNGGGDRSNGPAGITWAEGAVINARLNQTDVTALTKNITDFARMAVFPP